MRFVRQNRSGLVTLGALFLITVFAFLASHAGEILSDADNLTSPLARPEVIVREANTDADGNIKVHEQGTVTVRLDDSARQPFQQIFIVGETTYTVPEGKRLVVEYASGTVSGSATCQANYALLRTTVVVDGKDQIATHLLAPTAILSPITFVFSHQTRVYADAETDLRVLVETDPNNCGAGFVISVSGYLEDVN